MVFFSISIDLNQECSKTQALNILFSLGPSRWFILSKLQHFQWLAYQRTQFQWHEPPLNRRSFVILTAHNPKGQRRSNLANAFAHSTLVRQLRVRRWPYSVISGMSPDASHSELSLAVACSLSQGVCMAQRFKQHAIYWIKQDKLYLVAVLNGKPMVSMGSFSTRCHSHLPYIEKA